MNSTPRTATSNRSDQDPGSPIASSTPDTSPKPRKVRGFKIRKLVLPGCGMDGVPEEDVNLRSELRVFNLRCIRQTNDIVQLHDMIRHYSRDYEYLTDIEHRHCITLIDAMYNRLLELNCKCVDCDDYRCELSDLVC